MEHSVQVLGGDAGLYFEVPHSLAVWLSVNLYFVFMVTSPILYSRILGLTTQQRGHTEAAYSGSGTATVLYTVLF